jgi:hypothetical protein
MTREGTAVCLVVSVIAVAVGGCATSKETRSNAAHAGASEGAGALSAEARSAGTGDIPDNQVFLVLSNRAAGYSMKYPEGWTQSGSANNVTLKDKNNIVHVAIQRSAMPTPGSVTRELEALKASTPTLSHRVPHSLSIGGNRAIMATYTTRSSTDPVTGRSVLLVVDRYVLFRNGRVAIVDLGTPRGVDNVDAYRKMIESFRWS